MINLNSKKPPGISLAEGFYLREAQISSVGFGQRYPKSRELAELLHRLHIRGLR